MDPNATGVLPLLVGNATKISKYLINHDKEYQATLQLGKKTSTADGEGDIIEEKEVNKNILDDVNVKKVLASFIGKQKQTPPIYSAIKIDGKKLYQYAREGKNVKIEPRTIEIYDRKLLEIDKEKNKIIFWVKCSKGTYIRTLCENIAERLDSIGYMKELCRLAVGNFKISQSMTISEIEEGINNNSLKGIITLEEFFKNYPKIEINDEETMKKYINGISIKVNNQEENSICCVFYQGKFTGIGVIKEGHIKRDLVI